MSSMTRDFENFALDLFPDLDPEALRAVERNPKQALPADVHELLDLVSCGTGVPKSWLEKSARLVLDGLAGCRCLWYLHGVEGEIREEIKDLPHLSARNLYSAFLEFRFDPTVAKDPSFVGFDSWDLNWGEGWFEVDYLYRDKSPKRRRFKLGKLLRELGYKSDLIKAFETRQLPVWQWKISTHPFDVLTMSFDRPWTSCMRPGGAAELGPLTDMAAGTAVMFFYRPGAAKPCGRRLLRPVAIYSEDFGIVDAGSTKGSGPADLGSREVVEDMLAEASGYRVQFYGIEHLCPYGVEGEALTRYIFSDPKHEYCQQTDEQYADAYARLLDAPWPPSRLDLGDLYDRAAGLRELVEHEESARLTDVVREVANVWADQNTEGVMGLIGLIHAARNSDIPSASDDEYMDSCGIDPYDNAGVIRQMMSDRFEELVTEYLVSAPVEALVVTLSPGDVAEDSVENVVDRCVHDTPGGVVLEVWRGTAVLDDDQAQKIPEDVDVESTVVYPQEFSSVGFREALEDAGYGVITLELPPGQVGFDWERQV